MRCTRCRGMIVHSEDGPVCLMCGRPLVPPLPAPHIIAGHGDGPHVAALEGISRPEERATSKSRHAQAMSRPDRWLMRKARQ